MKLSQLKSTLRRHRGVALKHQYKVIITSGTSSKLKTLLNRDAQDDLNILAESFTLPDRTIETFEWGIWNHTINIPKGYKESGIDITFVATNDFFIKNLFDDWVSYIVDEQSYLVSYPEEYKGQIDLYYTQNEISESNARLNVNIANARLAAFDNSPESREITTQNLSPVDLPYKEIKNYGIRIKGAYPTLVKNIELSSADDTPAKVTVTFAFDRYERITNLNN